MRWRPVAERRVADFLADMASASRRRVEQARARISEPDMLDMARSQVPPPPLRRLGSGFDVIAELKLVSPAAGRLREQQEDIAGRVRAYSAGGACAVSVLTEPSRFGGDLEHLRQAAAALLPEAVPAMRKDFLVDPYQVLEARAAGAGGVLVILRMLDDSSVLQLSSAALELGMFVLLEAFDMDELGRAGRLLNALAPVERVLLGLNCRDLRSLQVDPGRFEQAADAFPAGVMRVAESGIDSPAQAAWARGLGYEFALVGTALMRSGTPALLLRDMLQAAATRQEAGT
jgi:indole-3-glycerol phosphate synthase